MLGLLYIQAGTWAYHWELGTGTGGFPLPLGMSLGQAGRGRLGLGWWQNPVWFSISAESRKGLEERRPSSGDLGVPPEGDP